MAEPKTKPTNANVEDFINQIDDEQKRDDAHEVAAMMKKITRAEPKMWGSSIVGFGSYTYSYSNGKQLDWPLTGFSPRKKSLTLYVMSGFDGHKALVEKLGKCKTGKGCLYINSLEEVDTKALKELIKQSVDYMKKKHKA